jgi:uncharacterized integral membrane protein (TIGR00697 family)
VQLPGSTVEGPVSPKLAARRETVFLILAGLFLGTLAMLNILGIARFWAILALDPDGTWAWWRFPEPGGWAFIVAIGVLPYPITFLCTDLISEFYGRTRANRLVLVGLLLNGWVVLVMWVAGIVPGGGPADEAFMTIRTLSFGAVTASMIAYFVAQLVDVHVFHLVKRLTGGRLLWIRNNASTLVSQFVDTFSVITITYFWADALPTVDASRAVWPQLWVIIFTGYAFKATMALLDTPIIYGVARFLKGYLQVDPTKVESRPHVDAG